MAACRDWFQLTLKEGLTVYRDSTFSADMTSEAVKRIEDVRVMRAHQFVEDAGPMAHPIRPESYIAMDNFYTVTVYNKGAEVIRMYRTLLGWDTFRKGTSHRAFDRSDSLGGCVAPSRMDGALGPLSACCGTLSMTALGLSDGALGPLPACCAHRHGPVL